MYYIYVDICLLYIYFNVGDRQTLIFYGAHIPTDYNCLPIADVMITIKD